MPTKMQRMPTGRSGQVGTKLLEHLPVTTSLKGCLAKATTHVAELEGVSNTGGCSR